MINSRFLDGMTIEQAKEEVARRLEKETRGNRPVAQAPGQFPPARLGHFTPALLGLPDPGHPLRDLRRRAGAGKGFAGARCRKTSPSTSPAIRSIAIRPGRTSRARNAASRRGAKPTPWIRSSTRPGTSRASPIRGARTRRPIRKVVERVAAGRSIYRRHRARDLASALQPLLHPRDESHRPCRHGRAVRRPLHPGHGGARDLSQGRRRMGHAGRSENRRRRRQARAQPDRDRRAGRDRLASRRCRSRSAIRSIPTTSSTASAPTPRAGSCCPIHRPSAT